MTEDNQRPLHSPLAQSLTRAGKTVQIEIYEDGKGGWILEVVDEHGNSTVWDHPKSSDAIKIALAQGGIAKTAADKLAELGAVDPVADLPVIE